ncbi:MAG: ComEC/Rec2 family competence protein [Nocardioides sp.]
MGEREASPERPDLRLPLLGLAAWVGGLGAAPVGALGRPTGALLLAGALVGGAVAFGLGRGRGAALTWVAVVLVATTVASAAVVREAQLDRDPVAVLARDGAAVRVVLSVSSDPRLTVGRFADQVLFRARLHEVTGRGRTHAVGVPVLVVAPSDWAEVALGSRLRVDGRLSTADDPDLAGVLSVRGTPAVVAAPDIWWRGAGEVRAALRASVAHRPDDQRALVPALVVGDDAAMDTALVADFRVTGLTHLTAVSGTNLTLLVGFLLVVGRWVGVRGRWTYVLAAGGIVGFLLLARAEPSVVRAAAMGTVALVGLGSNGLRRGTRALGAAVVGLLLVDPWLARSLGFALSVLATGGILLLAPDWRDALARWLPRWLAEAVAVPAAAQLVCTPVVAAVSGQVSLVAVGANLLVAPVVGPATVLGLAAGLLGLAWGWLGQAVGTLASWCVAWIVLVAEQGARLPGAAVDWGVSPLSLGVLTLLCVLVARVAPYLLARRSTGIASCVLLVLGVVSTPPSPGWPPDGWLLVACDVGQGDALVVRTGPGAGIVIDAGPDPAAVDRCLRRLGVHTVPLVVLTHFHADHVDGLPGVLAGRAVGQVVVTSLPDPAEGAADVAALTRERGLATRVPVPGETWAVGAATLQVLWPVGDLGRLAEAEGSPANNSSVVLLVEVAGIHLLLTGDIEPAAQEQLARALPDLRVDVLKIPHHGSRNQDLDFLLGLRPRLALVSVGADNDYGHPASETLAPLAALGARVLRTDRDGDLAVVVRDGRLLTDTGR